jgi:rubrerythrin
MHAYFDHFAREALLAGLIGTEAENLRDLIGHEARESDRLYRVFAEQADAVGDTEAAGCFRKVGEQERRRRERLLDAMRALDPAAPGQ